MTLFLATTTTMPKISMMTIPTPMKPANCKYEKMSNVNVKKIFKKQHDSAEKFCLLFSTGSCTYYFQGQDFLRTGCIDSQAGDAKDADGKHPSPTQARASKRRQLLHHGKGQRHNTDTELIYIHITFLLQSTNPINAIRLNNIYKGTWRVILQTVTNPKISAFTIRL